MSILTAHAGLLQNGKMKNSFCDSLFFRGKAFFIGLRNKISRDAYAVNKGVGVRVILCGCAS